MFIEMIESLKKEPPYHSVFGFTRVSNLEAQAFYGQLGFNLTKIEGVYADGHCILFHQSFSNLLNAIKVAR